MSADPVGASAHQLTIYAYLAAPAGVLIGDGSKVEPSFAAMDSVREHV